jgi:hypothetical protein
MFVLGQAAKPALPEIVALARKDPDPEVRAAAQEVLRRLSHDDYVKVSEELRRAAGFAP